ncbi:unnamed protein product (macronuclear) [Paramecium tetraurelia]|uniref:MSP domain-containing protein n=1 Tax=Paramecium tetraurelia TaxID=5888 RepID=A0CK74_PARTE|nr:uncharacterized protein GSPATT00000904001 [Paramecium tetraurelia]CAK71191.1 unnamed protein product [Paramecium tetraurelia]|eukprot:XP_001438588.1 hypothetical protein (macronuclear) [Paramecium tetraurelia strain d4-2]
MNQLVESQNILNEQQILQSEQNKDVFKQKPLLKPQSPSNKENRQEQYCMQKQQLTQKSGQDNSRTLKNENVELKNLINVNKQLVNFGLVLPGNICEDDIQFQNISNETILIEIQVVCNNTEFDDLDEYVYSARKLNGYDYKDRFMLACPGQKQFSMKVALKVPNIKDQKGLFGLIIITALNQNQQKIQGQINTILQSQVLLPLIQCSKQLINNLYNLPIIQMAFKLGKKLDCKIQFRNNSIIGLSLEMEILDKINCEIIVNPQAISVQSNSQFLVTMNVKNKEVQQIKNVLIIKIKNSNVHFSYPFIIQVY